MSIAEHRAGRPIEYFQTYKVSESLDCPFCNGNEPLTPPAIIEYRDDNVGSDWIVRTLPNKYPAFFSDHFLNPSTHGPYQTTSSTGSHELIIESSRHVASFSQLEDVEIRYSMIAYQDALRRQRENSAIRHVSIFKNCRYDAGASIEHVHTQLIGLPIVTDETARRLDNVHRYEEENQASLFDTILNFEEETGERIVSRSHNFTAFSPFASRVPYQVCIFPNSDVPCFEDADVELVEEFGLLAREIVSRLELVVAETPYNLIIHLPPFGYDRKFRWFAEILPRINKTAGFEWATKCWINPVPPEKAARLLANSVLN